MRAVIVLVVALTVAAAINHSPFKPLPTSSLPAVNVP
jgi:hypothetical protein